MNAPTTDDPASSEKIRKDEMRQEICDFAHALLRRGGSPLLVVQAMIEGTLAFAGRIGEEAMRNYIDDVDYIDHIGRKNELRRTFEEKKDELPF